MKLYCFIVLLFLLTCANTVIAQAPKVTSFSPAVGPIGTQVVIDGSGFNAIPDSNVVYFGATHAVVNSSDASQLLVTVPMGATYKPITVINKTTGLSGQSAVAFRTTFSPATSGVDPPVRLLHAAGIADVQVADIDGDGKPDIIATNPTLRTLMIFLNKSTTGKIDTGSFAAPVIYPTGAQPGIVTVQDMDGDGRLDIVLMNVGFSDTLNGNNSLSIFHNLSTPGKIKLAAVAMVDSTAVTPVSYNFRLKPGDNVARTGDFDGDGKPDIAVLNTAGFISIYHNKYVAGLSLKTILGQPVTIPVSLNPISFVVGDLDNDGKMDMVISNYNSSSLTVLHNNITTDSITTSSFQNLDVPIGFQPLTISLDDIDCDGKLDALISTPGDGSAYLIHNTSTPGHFSGKSISPSSLDVMSNYNDDIVIQDVDGDGKPDVLSLNADLNNLFLYPNKSVPGQTSADYFADKIKLPVGTIPDCIADLDGDGRPDIIVGSMFGIDVYHSKFAAVQAAVTQAQGDMVIYPNPASVAANIRYDLPVQSEVQISVFNAVGKLLSSVTSGQQSAGTHISPIATANLKTGVYVVKITANNYMKAGKLIVL